MRLLIAGGGTGGHIFPALAVTDALRRRPNPPELHWLGGQRGLEGTVLRGTGMPFERLVLRSLRSTERDLHLVLDPLRLLVSIPQALVLLARRRPAAIFATGGYLAIPVLAAAALLRIPSLLWEGNVVPGRANRLVAGLASVVAASFPATLEAFRAGRRGYLTGTPIRDVGAIDRLAAREQLAIGPADRVLLVFGGSQAVRRFNRAVTDALPALVERCVVIHVAGEAGYAEALASRERLPPERRARYRPAPFLREDMLPSLAAADLVVGRAGSSTLAEATALGLPLVVVPYPHAAGHQRANAEALVAAGAARLIEDEAFDGPALVEAAALLDDPAAHLAMSAAARDAGRPGAAAAVAELLMALAERRPLPAPAELERRAAGAA